MGFATRIAVSGLVLGLAACEVANTVEDNNSNKFVMTVSNDTALYTESSNARASLFAVPREARVLLLAHP